MLQDFQLKHSARRTSAEEEKILRGFLPEMQDWVSGGLQTLHDKFERRIFELELQFNARIEMIVERKLLEESMKVQAQEKLNINLDGSWISHRDAQNTIKVINADTVTWHDGVMTQLRIKRINDFEMDFGGSTYSGELLDDGKIHWSDGDTWTRQETKMQEDSPKKPKEEEPKEEEPKEEVAVEEEEVEEEQEKVQDDEDHEDITYSQIFSHAQRETTYKMEESLWDASALVGHKAIGLGGSIVVSSLLLLNMLIQMTFSRIVMNTFLEPKFAASSTYRTWRYTDGHSYTAMDGFTRQSLATRVCKADRTLSVATSQVDVIEIVEAYTQSMFPGFEAPSGVILCTLCVFLFGLLIINEVDTTIRFLKSFTKMRGPGRTLICRSDEDGYDIKNVSYSRLVFIYCFTFIRLLIAGVLMVCGSLWLSNETSIENLVLNAAALEFVMDVDETMYAAFCPKLTRSLLENMDPIPLKLNRTVSGVGAQLVAYALFIFSFVSFFVVYRITPLQNSMFEIQSMLCAGKQDFVIGVQLATGQLFTGKSVGVDETIEVSIAMKAVEQILDKKDESDKSLDDNGFSSYFPSLSLQGTINVALGEYVAQARHRCRDRYLPNDPPRLAAIRSRTRNLNATRCEDVKDKCDSFRSGSLVRFLCPDTCKCGMPRAGLYLDGPMFGCARAKCREDPQTQRENDKIVCKDETPRNLNNPQCIDLLIKVTGALNTTELDEEQTIAFSKGCKDQTSRSWILFWNQYLQFWGDRSAFYTGMKQQALTKGCNFKDIDFVCEETGAVGSVRSYCPVTCGCRREMNAGCPSKCRAYSQPIIPAEAKAAINAGLITIGNSTAR